MCPSDDIQSSVDRQIRSSASQILMVLSNEPEITYSFNKVIVSVKCDLFSLLVLTFLPSDMDRQVTASLWPDRVPVHVPCSTDHTCKVKLTSHESYAT